MRLLVRSFRRRGGFTLIELLTVMTVIAILAGLVLSISGYANKKGALARAQAEIQALSTACESYKADYGTYPHQPLAVSGSIPAVTGAGTSSSNIPSDLLDPRTNGNSVSSSASSYTPGSVLPTSPVTTASYMNASLELYQALSGDLSCTGTGGGPGVKNYISDLRQDVLGRANAGAPVSGTGSPANTVYYLSDPFGNCYGYSTANATSVANQTSTITGYPSSTATYPGYNPTFDLWCTGGSFSTPNNGTGASAPGAPGDPILQWIKNW